MNDTLFVWEFPSLYRSGSVGCASLRYTIQKLTIQQCMIYISLFACHKQTDDGWYSLYHIEKLKDFIEQFKSGLIPFL